MTEDEFAAIEKQDGFIETNLHVSNDGVAVPYGSPKSELTNAWDQGKTPIMRVDPNGARRMRQMWQSGIPPFDQANIVYIYITAPTHDQLRDRLVNREVKNGIELQKAQEKVEKRWEQVIADLEGIVDAHFVVINHENQFETTVAAVHAIFASNPHLVPADKSPKRV